MSWFFLEMGLWTGMIMLCLSTYAPADASIIYYVVTINSFHFGSIVEIALGDHTVFDYHYLLGYRLRQDGLQMLLNEQLSIISRRWALFSNVYHENIIVSRYFI